MLTFYERLVQAGRHDRLRPVVRDWNAQLVELVAAALAGSGRAGDLVLARALPATVDGLLVGALAEGDERPVAAATPVLAGILHRLG